MKKAKLTYKQVKEQIRKQQQQIAKEALEKAMNQEREERLEEHPEDRGNGYYERTLLDDELGKVEGLRVPRTRSGQFYPSLLPPRWQRMTNLLSTVFLALFAAGLSRRRIIEVMEYILGFRVSALPQKAFALWIDAARIRLWYQKTVVPCLVLVAVILNYEGYRQVADFEVVVADGEQKDCYRELLERLRQRGLKHVEVIVTDGLPGLDEVIAEVFPGAQHQLCVLHMLRQWLAKVRKQDRKRISNLLRQMLIEADNPQHAHQLLQTFVQQYGRTYPSIVRSL